MPTENIVKAEKVLNEDYDSFLTPLNLVRESMRNISVF